MAESIPSARPVFLSPIRGGGFTLLEVLIALVVSSIGLLGLAALQANGLRDNHGAYLRSQAAYIASDMADRMRVNVDATIAGAYLINAAPSGPAFDCINNFSGTVVANACSPTEMAQADLRQWYLGLQAILPSGQAMIICSDTPCARGSLHTIIVRWDGDRDGGIGDDPECDPEIGDDEPADDLYCIQMAFQP